MSERKSTLGFVKTSKANLGRLKLEGGEEISSLEIAYETYGTLSDAKDNAILICHALSGDAHAAGIHETTNKIGWWDEYIGPSKPFDTNKYFIISSNVVGGCMGSTGPLTLNPKTQKPYKSDFPFVSITDMVNAQKKLIEYLGIEILFCVAGGSMGGMQALQWSVSYPNNLVKCIVLASSSEHSAQQIAFNEVGRQAIIKDPNWNNGLYDDNLPRIGLSLARMFAHITYLSDESMREKFGRNPPRGSIGQNTEFAVGSYLLYQGDNFVDRFDANSYIYVTKALDHFSLGRGKELSRNLSSVKAEYLVIAFSSDWLYPPYQSREIVKSLEVNMVPVTYCEINYSKGHDSFLIYNQEQAHLIHHFLESSYNK